MRRRYIGQTTPEGLVEDLAQDVLASYYSKNDWDRPDTQQKFEVWAVETCLSLLAEVYKTYKREVPSETWGEPNSKADDGSGEMLYSRADIAAAKTHYIYAHNKPMQLIRCDFNDALKMIAMLPKESQKLIWDVFECENVLGYAKDRGVGLGEAMARLKQARAIMNRLADDLADEKKEAAYGKQTIKA